MTELAASPTAPSRRYLLLPEAAREASPGTPRIRRYRLSSLSARHRVSVGPPERRPAGDFGHLQDAHD